MAPVTETNFDGFDGERVARSWVAGEPRYLALLCHGYGEHIGRYDYVAQVLTVHGAAVYGVDHVGHGKSAGGRVVITDFDRVVDDFHLLAQRARTEHPDLPVIVIGHSMGGMIAARYAQRFGSTLTALVLSGPVLGRWEAVETQLAMDEIPDEPIDTDTLSRDPEVGRAYTADPLIWHGPFQRPTLEAFASMLTTINDGGELGDLPTLWVHGADDQLVPIEGTQVGIDRIRGSHFEQEIFPGARHEVFNEVNRQGVLATVTRFIDRVLSKP
ncbi:MAG: alpha/beta hydrolase [Propionibacteriaceae bacterium]